MEERFEAIVTPVEGQYDVLVYRYVKSGICAPFSGEVRCPDAAAVIAKIEEWGFHLTGPFGDLCSNGFATAPAEPGPTVIPVDAPFSKAETWKVCLCGQRIDSTDPAVDYCRGCFYDGTAVGRRVTGLLTELGGEVVHTGGGCFVMEVTLPDGGFLWASLDEDARIPDTEDGPWWLGQYPPDDQGDGDIIAQGLDRAGLVAAVTAVVAGFK